MEREQRLVKGTSSYVIDSESAAELTRLKIQSAMVTRAMGGLLTDIPDLSGVHDVLDIACGPGDWACELARAHPHLHVTGVDISQRMIDYANSTRLANTQYQMMDITQPLDFASASFDVINARLLFGVLSPHNWPPLLQECLRLLRPGGYLRLTEAEWGLTNKEACERFGGMLMHALHTAGQSFSPDGRQAGITPMLGGLLEEAGFQQQLQRAFSIDFSADATDYQTGYENSQIGYLLIQPFLVKMGEASEEELAELYQQALTEMQAPDFRGVWYYLTVLGQKPLA